MTSLKTFIKTTKIDSPTNIRFRLRDGRDVDLYGVSKITIHPSHWNFKTELPRTRSNFDNKVKLQYELNSLKTFILTEYQNRINRKPPKSWLKETITRYYNPLPIEELTLGKAKPTLFEFIDNFIKTGDKRKDKHGKLLSVANLYQHKITFRHLKEYAKRNKQEDYSFDDINDIFYDKFIDYLQNLNFSSNSIGKYIRILKLFLSEATKIGYNTNTKYIQFRVFTEDVDNCYLTETELHRIHELDLKSSPRLERVRDWFLILCWTGSRYSDLAKFSSIEINDNYISYRQQKTNNKVVIPLHPIAREILERNKGVIPKPISNQRFNEYLKEVAKAADINSKESITRTEGGVRITREVEKWQLVSSHTGRRSFCTNMYLKGLPSLMIMSISGHKTEKAFLKYIKVSQKQHAELMAEQWKILYKKPIKENNTL